MLLSDLIRSTVIDNTWIGWYWRSGRGENIGKVEEKKSEEESEREETRKEDLEEEVEGGAI